MSHGLLETNYNPDVLSCLANLSNDEVFTPPEIVNKMLDDLPQELFSNPDITFLDPASKTGVFLREIAKRLIKGLEKQIPDLQERLDHIFHNQLFGIAITDLTGLLSRRGVYCSKYPDSKYSVSQFNNSQGNIRFKRIEHIWGKDRKCIYCGASKEKFNRDVELENHAYEFIHLDDPKEIFKMKFDVIIGNVPYHIKDGGNNASATPIYNRFVDSAKKMNPQYISMIIPARWFAGGKGLAGFRKTMLEDKRIKQIVDVANSRDIFPGVNIAGGVCYFLWDRNYNGNCKVINSKNGESLSEIIRPLDEYKVLVRNNLALSIIHKIENKSTNFLDSKVFSRNYFDLPTTIESSEKFKNGFLPMLSSKGLRYINQNRISDNQNIVNHYKVITTYAMSGGNKPSKDGKYKILSSLQILEPGEVCTETYLILDIFKSREEAESFLSYLKCKFPRFLLLQVLSSIHIKKELFLFVPCPPSLNTKWTDKALYKYYELSDEEINHIESTIKEYK